MHFSLLKYAFSLLMVLASYLGYSQANLSDDHVKGELLIMLKSWTNVREVCTSLERETSVAFNPKKNLSAHLGIWLISFDTNLNDYEALLQAERNKSIQIAQFNHTNLVTRAIPNDSLFAKQWPFLNDGTNGGSGLADIDASAAWDIATGGNTPENDTIVVAVIDQGFDVDHEDLVANMFFNHHEIDGNGIDDDNNGYIDDVQGWDVYSNDPIVPNSNHGTHVAGTVGARGDNTIGVTGVNWDVKILPIAGSSTYEATVVEAYAYVLEMRRLYNTTGGQKGAYIVAANSSFGVDDGQPEDYPLWCAMFDSLGQVGVLSIGATANDDVDVDVVGDIPTACESNFLISVTNMRSNDELNGNAGFGETTIDIGAPGTNVYSTRNNDNYGNSSGTSMAAPHIAGAVGLMYSAVCPEIFDAYKYNPSGMALFMKQHMLEEGVDVLKNLQGVVVSGGRLNLEKAVVSVSNLCLNVTLDVTASECDSCNGSIHASTIGTSGNVSYEWSTGSTADSISDLCAGIYQVTVMDDVDTVVKTIALSDLNGPTIDVTSFDVSCADLSDGYISVTGGYNYEWNDGNSSSVRSLLGNGSYFLFATDVSGTCTTAVEVIIHAPDSIFANYEFTLPSTIGGSDGTLTAQAFGGVPSYSYLWETGDTNATLSGVSEGNYGIAITDANGCTIWDSATLGFPNSISSALPQDAFLKLWPNPAGNFVWVELPLGTISAIVYGSRGEYLFEILAADNGLRKVDISNYPDGLYLIKVEARNGAQVAKFMKSANE